jgi:hypothetical protein
LSEIGASSVFGPVELRSLTGTPIIAVSRVYSVSRNTSGFFNAQPAVFSDGRSRGSAILRLANSRLGWSANFQLCALAAVPKPYADCAHLSQENS